MSEPIKAAFILENPAVQNPLGIVDRVLSATAWGSHSCPPLSHSHCILSFPRCNCTIITIARIELIIIMNIQMNLQTLVHRYDWFERAMALIPAATAMPNEIPPYICHSGKKKNRNWPRRRSRIPPARLYINMIEAHAMAPARSGRTSRQLSHHIASGYLNECGQCRDVIVRLCSRILQ